MIVAAPLFPVDCAWHKLCARNFPYNNVSVIAALPVRLAGCLHCYTGNPLGFLPQLQSCMRAHMRVCV